MDNKAEEEIISGWKIAESTLEQERHRKDEEDEVWPKRRRLEITQGTIVNSDVGMPEKARSTLVGPGRKRSKSQKTL
ncbi:hypothetical protein MMC34_002402 [Xylographa carneopallida]|nr:hypothetical protein [Xylographa carneopallida]